MSELAHIQFIWLEVEMGLIHQGWWIRVILQAHMRRRSSGCTEEAGREDLGLLRICYQSSSLLAILLLVQSKDFGKSRLPEPPVYFPVRTRFG